MRAKDLLSLIPLPSRAIRYTVSSPNFPLDNEHGNQQPWTGALLEAFIFTVLAYFLWNDTLWHPAWRPTTVSPLIRRGVYTSIHWIIIPENFKQNPEQNQKNSDCDVWYCCPRRPPSLPTSDPHSRCSKPYDAQKVAPTCPLVSMHPDPTVYSVVGNAGTCREHGLQPGTSGPHPSQLPSHA